MILEIDLASPVPAYEQIRTQVITMITAGVLSAGARLPPIRQLAADLGLAANTVARAYRELENDQWVVSRVRHGTTVSAQRPALPHGRAQQMLAEAARSYAVLAHHLGVPPDQAEATVRAALTTLTQAHPSGAAAEPTT